MLRATHLWLVGCLFLLGLLSCCNIGGLVNGDKETVLNGVPLTRTRVAPDPRPWWGQDSMVTAKRWGPYQFWDTVGRLYPVMPTEDSATGFVGIGHNQYHGKWDVFFYSAELDNNNRPTALECYLWLYAAPMSKQPESEGTYSTAVYTGYDVRIANDRMKCLGDTIVITDRTSGHTDSVIMGVSGRFPLRDTLHAAIRPSSPLFDYGLYYIPSITFAHGNNSVQRGRVMLRWVIERYGELHGCKTVPNPFTAVVRLYGVRHIPKSRQIMGFVEDVPVDIGLQAWKKVTSQTNDGDPSGTSVQ